MTNKVSRRELLKKSGYVAPVVVTLSATPSIASVGSGGSGGGPGPDPSGGKNCRWVTIYRWRFRRVGWRWQLVRVPVGRRMICR